MKIVFLEVDGVLINIGSVHENKPDPVCVMELNRITRETGAYIVVSSAWRAMGYRRMVQTLLNWGVEGDIIDITPTLYQDKDWPADLDPPTRGHEIDAWLDRYVVGPFAADYPLDSFVILDDNADMGHLIDRLVQTSFRMGLMREDADRAISLLTDTF